jgi:hypothetical protein
MKFRHREQRRIDVGRHVMPLRGLTAVPATFRSVRYPLPRDHPPILIDDVVADHPTIDTAPPMKVRRRTSLHREAVVPDGEAVTS